QMLMARKAEHQIARPHAGQTGVGVHAHDGRVPMVAGLGVPTRMEGRIERETMLRYLDRGDRDFRDGSLSHSLFPEHSSRSWWVGKIMPGRARARRGTRDR